MSEKSAGEKTEQPTAKKLEEAINRGQFARSSEIQTVFVLFSGFLAFLFAGRETWRQLLHAQASMLGHLHDIPITLTQIPNYGMASAFLVGKCVSPVLIAVVLGGLLAGGLQSRFRTASEALTANWGRLNPVEGMKRLFSFRSAVPTSLAALKFAVIFALSYGVVKSILADPIFYSVVDVARIAEFLADSAFKIFYRVLIVLIILAALDYSYQLWRTNKDLMMTKEEVKDEVKNSEGNPQIKAQQRRKRVLVTQRKMFLDVPQADVVVTNPTHLAVALRYDRKTMKAPKVLAKGSRLKALKIREIAQQHGIPIVENKPLARLLFKHAKLGGEVPAQLYAAVAEVLAWVYRINAYRYYRERQM